MITTLVLHSSYQALFASDGMRVVHNPGLDELPENKKNQLAAIPGSMEFSGPGLKDAEKSELFQMMGEAFLEHLMLSGEDPGAGIEFQGDFQEFIKPGKTWKLESGKTV